MNDIYFIDEKHKDNYEKTLLKWKLALKDTEYQSACYILSVPMIFEKVENVYLDFESPVSWIWQWEWYYTISQQKGYEEEDRGKEPAIDLTSSMVQLGKFALNMWNGYDNFNLRNCISTLDSEHYEVLKCAIDIRMGSYKN